MARQIILNQEECIGCQSCEEICPEVFGFDEKIDKALVLPDAESDAACAEEAAAACPVACIEVA